MPSIFGTFFLSFMIKELGNNLYRYKGRIYSAKKKYSAKKVPLNIQREAKGKPEPLAEGLYRYGGKIRTAFKTYSDIPADLQTSLQETVKEKLIGTNQKKVRAEIKKFEKRIKDENGKKRIRVETQMEYFFEDGRKATEQDYLRYQFSLTEKEKKRIEKTKYVEFNLINQSVLTAIEKAISENKSVLIKIKGKKIKVNASNYLLIRKKLNRLIKKEIKAAKTDKKGGSPILFFSAKENNNSIELNYINYDSDEYNNILDGEL